jgi:hypothetical protein
MNRSDARQRIYGATMRAPARPSRFPMPSCASSMPMLAPRADIGVLRWLTISPTAMHRPATGLAGRQEGAQASVRVRRCGGSASISEARSKRSPMRSCAAWSANSSFAAFGPSDWATISLWRGGSHGTALVHCIRSGFASPQRHWRRRDLPRPVLGRAWSAIPAGRSLYARARTEMARKAFSRSRLPRRQVSGRSDRPAQRPDQPLQFGG